MLVNITQAFDEGRRYYAGENPDVDPQVAKRWIADGKATADTDGKADSPSGGGGGGGSSTPADSVTSSSTIVATTTATAGDAAFTAFGDVACTELFLTNNIESDLEYQRGGAGDVMLLRPGQSRRIVGITNANQIGVRRGDYTSTVSRPTGIRAQAITRSTTYTVGTVIATTITNGGGGQTLTSAACTALDLVNNSGKRIMWKIGSGSMQPLGDGCCVLVQGITNANQISLQPNDSVASFAKQVYAETFTGTPPLETMHSGAPIRAIGSDARIPLDGLNYPAMWASYGPFVAIGEQNDQRKTLIPKGAVMLASFPSVATSTLSIASACTDETDGDLLFGTSAVEYTQATASATALFAPASTSTATNVQGTDIHIGYSWPTHGTASYLTDANYGSFAIELHSAGSPSAPTANYHSLAVTKYATNWRQGGRSLCRYAFPASAFSAVGTGADLSAVTWARLKLVGGTTTGGKFRPHGVWAVPRARSKAACVFLFDDLSIGPLTNVLPLLAKYGYPACLGVDTVAKAGQTGYLTPEQMRMLHQQHGWQMIAQVQGGGFNGQSLTTDTGLAEDAAIAHVSQFRLAMKALGISDTEDFSYGSTSWTTARNAAVKRLFRTGTLFLQGNNATNPFYYPETVPFADPYAIKRMNMSGFTAGTFYQRWQEHVDQAIAAKGVAVFGAHTEFNGAGEALTAMGTLVEYLRTQELAGNIEVLTMAQLVRSVYQ